MKLSDYKRKQKPEAEREAKEMFKDLLREYEGKNEDELVKTIIGIAKAKRAEGTLTDEEIENFYNMLAPNVNAAQRAKLDEIAAMLKKTK